ncbi:MAG: hypothetical protein WCD01_16300 [Candidatus Sulfotelmatobacter sp.]
MLLGGAVVDGGFLDEEVILEFGKTCGEDVALLLAAALWPEEPAPLL